MSKQEEAGLILKLYELRREEVMRKARTWYFRDFHPQTIDDYNSAMYGENSAYLRMVVTYWEMAAALVNNGAIGLDLFAESNGEQIGVFAKFEPFLPELRASYGPHFAFNLEKLIDATPNGRKRTAETREYMKGMRERIAGQKAKAAQS